MLSILKSMLLATMPGLGTQAIRFPEHNQSATCWHTYNTELHSEPRLQTMAARLRAIGRIKLTEPSYADAASIALSNTRVSPDDLLKGTRDLKRHFHAVPVYV